MDLLMEPTDIQRFYKNSTVFLTGATGFIGKLVLEKVLRALPVKKVYILIRSKKDVLPVKRCQEILESPAFDLIKRTNPEVLQKVAIMEGDCSLPMLGMSKEDQDTFIEEVDVIFHVAATVRFDEALKKSVFTNVRGTRDLISLAKQIKKLKTFVYVGTGFSNCNNREIKEEIYPSRITAEKLIQACESLDDACVNSITQTLLDDWPNTYTFGKQVTEDYINREARGLPICIARPTIVVSTSTEPVASFVDNVYTLAGFVLGNALGLTRISYYKNTVLDIVPADLVVNHIIAVGWQTGESFKPYKTEVPVYNISSGSENPITQDEIYGYGHLYFGKVGTKHQIIYPLSFITTCKYNYLFWRFFFHTVTGYAIDFLLRMQGKQPKFADAVKKLHKFQQSYEYFTTNQFFFHVNNTQKLLRKMSFRERELFNLDIRTINWENYFIQYPKGLRIYILKDPLDTVPEGLKHQAHLLKVLIVTLVCLTVVLYVVGKIFLFRVAPVVFGLVLYLFRCLVC